MNQDEIRQLIRIRHELRRLMPGRDCNAAQRLLARMRALTSRDSRERAKVEPEIERWQVAFSLAATL
jgi:hypothetical protein